MSFRINPAPTFKWTVQITDPAAGSQSLSLVFRHKGREALEAWIARPGQLVQQGTPLADSDYLAEVISDFGAPVLDDNGYAVPFSAQALKQLLDAYPTAAREIYNAYLQALTESRAKT